MDITLELDTRYHERQKEKVAIKRRSLQSVDPTPPSLLKVHYQRSLITGRRRRGRIFKCPKTSLMLLYSLRTTNQLVLKRRGGLKKACATIVVESTNLKNSSRGLKISRVHQKASLASREKPEWGS
ncbi:hypothetical protein O181_077900 [Austropuccinia psidii MF-1]|uniref:Uncharacterized protein n=1 Tax=Austropuccinia psidii MF-1 TaxID=1389203 RepID=A0A9Q3FBP1_9BASI|nr:hypothetical protein [Austropuccinia psidii MF-1]